MGQLDKAETQSRGRCPLVQFPQQEPLATLGAFVGGTFGRDGLYTISPDGSDVFPVVLDPGIDKNGRPAWSPDGRRLAFAVRRAGHLDERQIQVVNFDGSGAVAIAPNVGHDDAEPAWSPDGRHLLFYSDRSGKDQIWEMRPDGTGLKQVNDSARGASRPAWSPDGTRITFVLNDGVQTKLAVVNADGTDMQVLKSSVRSTEAPSWSQVR